MEAKKKWIIIYAVIGVIAIALHYSLLHLEVFAEWSRILPFIKELVISVIMLSAVLLVKNLTTRLIIAKVHNQGDRHNLLHVTNLIATSLLIIILTFTIFQKTANSLYSLGLISLVLGFALQAPITSFIGWLYIIFRHPYQAGNRVEIKGHRGDVIEISYLDTSIMECSGDYLGNDRRSGRIIKIPNSTVLNHEVINYSGDQIPFIWNEIAIQIAFSSDLHFVEECLIDTATKDFELLYPSLLKKNENWKPAVYYRINTYAWLEAVITYPVEPKDNTGKRNRVLRAALPMLNAQPEKVKFPEGTRR